MKVVAPTCMETKRRPTGGWRTPDRLHQTHNGSVLFVFLYYTRSRECNCVCCSSSRGRQEDTAGPNDNNNRPRRRRAWRGGRSCRIVNLTFWWWTKKKKKDKINAQDDEKKNTHNKTRIIYICWPAILMIFWSSSRKCFFSVNLRGRLFLPPHDINPRHFIFLFFFQLFLHDDDNVERTTKWPIETARERERKKNSIRRGRFLYATQKANI